MANKNLFKSLRGVVRPKADTRNEAGGVAYRFDAKHALAQYASTGCLNGTYYASAEVQLATVIALCDHVEPEFIARAAIYAREKGLMKDLPALLCAILASKGVAGHGLLAEVFDRVIDSPKMLRNFVQIVRSGVTGRKSLGSLPKRLVAQWIERRTDEQLFLGSVGQDPSIADIVKMVHPKPATKAREAMYGYLIGRPHDASMLPEVVQAFERFKRHRGSPGMGGNSATGPDVPGIPGIPGVPDVPFQMLTALKLTTADWARVARNASWQTLRMNLNTLARHGVFGDNEMVRYVAAKLRDEQAIAKARVLPYQLMMAYLAGNDAVPTAVREALQDAMEVATRNVPSVPAELGKVYVFPDVSGSMHSPVTGHRKGATTAVRCIDVAALVAAAMLRKNPLAEVIPFHDQAVTNARLNPRDSVMTNAKLLASLPSGGTNCSAPLAELNRRKATGGLVIYVSDNESWVDTTRHGRLGGGPTATMREWSAFKGRNPRAKMVCIDLQPYATTQAKESDDIVNVGGFSDQVFTLIAAVARGETKAGHWVKEIERVTL